MEHPGTHFPGTLRATPVTDRMRRSGPQRRCEAFAFCCTVQSIETQHVRLCPLASGTRSQVPNSTRRAEKRGSCGGEGPLRKHFSQRGRCAWPAGQRRSGWLHVLGFPGRVWLSCSTTPVSLASSRQGVSVAGCHAHCCVSVQYTLAVPALILGAHRCSSRRKGWPHHRATEPGSFGSWRRPLKSGKLGGWRGRGP